ncbi:hypothetical protein DV736_g1123, partial [Chaetothyriales sp. CBS 134916]
MEASQSNADNGEDTFEDAGSSPVSPALPAHTDPPATESQAKVEEPLKLDEVQETSTTNGIGAGDQTREHPNETRPVPSPPPTSSEDGPRTNVKDMAASFESNNTSSSAGTAKSVSKPSRFQGFTASLPAVPWPVPPTRSKSNDRATSPQPAAAATGRKTGAPFGWFSRSSASAKDVKSPPSHPDARRNTGASISTVGSSNPELMAKMLEDSDGRAPARQSLKEQFKLLRMREEAGMHHIDDPEAKEGGAVASLIGRSTSLGVSVASPQSVEADDRQLPNPDTPSAASHSPVAEKTVPVNPNLAPGTVSGISTSATAAAAPIDWDFWQTIVNEGPQAVSRTSPEELAAAISSGIPQTIRGVIWQVLAGSKNEDLEAVYRELAPRSVQEAASEVPVFGQHNIQNDESVKDKAASGSTRSSAKSNPSSRATSANAGSGSPSPSRDPSDGATAAKIEAGLAAERARKAKEDPAALAKLEKMIRRDMGARTSYSKYTAAAGLQEPLFNVCKAYALFDEAVGYPQGMNFIIMPLLFTMSEEEAFCLLVRLMNKYQVRELFINDMPGLHLHLYQFERLLEDLQPALYCHLNRRGVTPKLYATQWFLTLFAYRFPLQLVMRVYDMVLSEGLEGAILKFGMAVIQRNVQTLLVMNDMQALTNFLKEKLFDVYIDATPSSKSILESGFFGNSGGTDNEVYRADLLVQDASSIRLTPEMLARYREEWEEKNKVETARETELENLRTDTATKASQIRSLEQRAEKSDAEHIELANELVKLKVSNQELADHNESLAGQVEELRKVAESEAKNVEEKLRAGMDQVMQRNVEVQNENRHMEEQMAEMEKELVAMKMKYAELNTDHESLKQKWSDLRKALE